MRAAKSANFAYKIRNGSLAHDVLPKTEVPFNRKGFHIFTQWLYPKRLNDIKLSNIKYNANDADAANLQCGFTNGTPKGYTWHHHEDYGRMQLV